MDKVTKRKVLARLERGLKRIEKGWCKGVKFARAPHHSLLSSRHATKFCALGAISDKSKDLMLDDLSRIVRSQLQVNLPRPFVMVVSFNDHGATTKKDVINLFKRTIERLKNDQPEAT